MKQITSLNDIKVGDIFIPISYKVVKTQNNLSVADGIIRRVAIKDAFEKGKHLQYTGTQFKKVDPGKEYTHPNASTHKPPVPKEEVQVDTEVMNFKTFIHNAVDIRPKLLKMPDLKWKYLVRSVMKGKNIMMVGDAGAGKTFAVQQLTKALNVNNKEVTKMVTKKELEALKKNLKVEIKSTKIVG